jgi:hypothetical protein
MRLSSGFKSEPKLHHWEPSLRFAPFKSNFYLYGPRLAFNMDKSFTYQLGTNPAYPEQTANPEVKS